MKIDQPEVEINGIKYIPKDSVKLEVKNTDGLKAVLIRSYASGVHFGFLKDEKFTEAGKVVTLVNSRHIFRWAGALCCNELAAHGVTNSAECKFSDFVSEIEIVNVIETIPLTDKAFNNLSKVAIWKQ